MQTIEQIEAPRRGRLVRQCRRAAYGGAAGAGLSAVMVSGLVSAAPTPDETVGDAVSSAQTDGQAFVVTYVIPAMLLALAFVGILGIGWVAVSKIYRKFRGA